MVVAYASVGDTLGRWLAGKKDLISKQSLLGICLISGAFFTVAYMLTFEGVWPKFFGSQIFVIVMLGLFSVSCGYLATISMKFGSDATTVHQGLAGTIMGIHLSFGISLGSTLAIAFLS